MNLIISMFAIAIIAEEIPVVLAGECGGDSSSSNDGGGLTSDN